MDSFTRKMVAGDIKLKPIAEETKTNVKFEAKYDGNNQCVVLKSGDMEIVISEAGTGVDLSKMNGKRFFVDYKI